MLSSFGDYVALIDCTYNTSVYNLPLCAIAVKTNVNFTYVVSSLIVHESTEAFVSVLQCVKQWNPSWNPHVFLTDFDEAQIRAIKTVFPGYYALFFLIPRLHVLIVIPLA